MARTDKDRAFRIHKPPGYLPPQTRHGLRHATPRRNDACIAKTCFFAGRLAVNHRDGQSSFSQLQGAADANYASANHDHLVTICPSAYSRHPLIPVSKASAHAFCQTPASLPALSGAVNTDSSGDRLRYCISSVRHDLGHQYRGCEQRRIQC